MNVSKIFAAVLPVLFLAPLAQSAERVIWNEKGVNETYPPRNIYSYVYDDDADFAIKLDTTEIGAAPYMMGARFKAKNETKPNGGAGFGFVWAVNDKYKAVPEDLSDYKGVCLTYSSSNIVRMDFVQDDIIDANYFGITLPSTGDATINTFVAFEKLNLGWGREGDNEWDVTNQVGLQFSYKAENVKKYGVSSDILIYALTLANSCPQHAPEVKKTFVTRYEINEGESTTIRMSDIFSDADGDSLAISATFKGNSVEFNYADTMAVTLADSITFKAMKNPAETDSLVFTITATDPAEEKAVCTIIIKPIDVKHAPTIKDTSFNVYQSETLEVTDLYDMVEDLDGDKVALYLDENRLPKFGTFDLNTKVGSFTYVAPAPDTVGDVSFFLYAVETGDPTSVSDTMEFVIHVLDVNDPPVVDIVDTAFNYYVNAVKGNPEIGKFNDSTVALTADEDFEDSIWVEIDPDKVSFSDPDVGAKLKYDVKTNGVVNAKIVTKGIVDYVVISAKENANGLAKVTYFVDDGEFQAGVDIYMKVKPVDDLPVANDDSYDAKQDLKISIKAKDGVLSNDVNVDDPEDELIAQVVDKPKHGTLKFEEDGSFTYRSDEDFRGEDTFTYICINSDEVESKPATVTITVTPQNMAPEISDSTVKFLEESLATLVEDKLTSGKVFKQADLNKWFVDQDGDPMTFDAKNEDGKLQLTVTTASIKISPVPDSSGTSEITLIATDSTGASTSVTLSVFIKPVNDKPVVLVPAEDAVYDAELKDWEIEIDLDTMVFDVDGDTLEYVLPKTNDILKEFFKMEIEDGHILKVSTTKKGLEPGKKYAVTVKASDAEYTVDVMLVFIAPGNSKDAIRSIAQQPKATWQNAVQASRGTVAIMDLQGRVMWNAKLPVSEADVRNASAKVQGRKVLRVNSQTWTIK